MMIKTLNEFFLVCEYSEYCMETTLHHNNYSQKYKYNKCLVQQPNYLGNNLILAKKVSFLLCDYEVNNYYDEMMT